MMKLSCNWDEKILQWRHAIVGCSDDLDQQAGVACFFLRAYCSFPPCWSILCA